MGSNKLKKLINPFSYILFRKLDEGDNVSYSLTHTKSEIACGQRNTVYSLWIMPDLGYFFMNKLAAGLKGTIHNEGSKATGTSVFSKDNDYDFGPFLRYYILPTDYTVNLLIEGSYQYAFIGGGQNKKTTSKNAFSIAAGPVVYFNSAVGLEFLLNYSTYKYVGFSGRNSTVTVSLGFQIYLKGYEIIFNRETYSPFYG
jgi:hypothetical protein